MSKAGALSKKELAEAGRRKLEEFKRKKQQGKATTTSDASNAGPGATAPALQAASTSVSAATATPNPAVALPTAPAAYTCAQQPEAAAHAITAQNIPVDVTAVSPKTNTAPPNIWGPRIEDPDEPSPASGAARAAAAGAAAAALEAAILGFPAAGPPSSTALTQQQGLTQSGAFHSSSDSAAAVLTASQFPFSEGDGQHSHIPSTQSAGLPAGPMLQAFPSPNPWTPAPLATSAAATSFIPTAAADPHWQEQQQQQHSQLGSPRADPSTAAQPEAHAAHPADQQQVLQQQQQHAREAEAAATSYRQRSSWLSLFGGRDSTSPQPSPQPMANGPHQPPGPAAPATAGLSSPAQQEGFNSLLLYAPGARNQTSRPLCSTALLPGGAGISAGVLPPRPHSTQVELPASADVNPAGEAQGADSADAAGNLSAMQQPQQQEPSTGLAQQHRHLSDTLMSPLTHTPQQQHAQGEARASQGANVAAASSSTAGAQPGMEHPDLGQQQQPGGVVHDNGGGGGVEESMEPVGSALASYASLSDSYLSPAPVDKQKPGAPTTSTEVTTTQDDHLNSFQLEQGQLQPQLSFGTGRQQHQMGSMASSNGNVPQTATHTALNSTSAYSTLSDSYMLRAAAAAGAAAAHMPSAQLAAAAGMQQPQQHSMSKLGTGAAANGNVSGGGSHSSLASLGLSGGVAGSGLSGAVGLGLGRSMLDHGTLALDTLGPAAAAALGSSVPGSLPGSGPPSTTSGALSFIQAHAEGSQRAAANMKLLQAHIDELTAEKLELLRGLQQQAKANEALAEENRALGEQLNALSGKHGAEEQALKQLQAEVAAAAASVAALSGERDSHRAAAEEAVQRANALAAENVSMENELLEARSAQLRHEKQAAAAAAATEKLETQLAKLTQRKDESSAELSALTSERRILKARLMQAEARMRAAGLDPLPPLPSSTVSTGEHALTSRVDAGVQVDLAPSASALPPDTSAPHQDLLAAAAGPVAAAAAQHMQQHLQTNREAAAVLAGLAAWLPQELLAEASLAPAAEEASAAAAAAGDLSGGDEGARGAASEPASVSRMSSVSLWREEARLASSVGELMAQLEESWGTVLMRLEQEQAHSQELQQALQVQQLAVQELQHRCQEQASELQQQRPAAAHDHHHQQQQEIVPTQEQDGDLLDPTQQPNTVAQHSARMSYQESQPIVQLPVSMPADSHASIAPTPMLRPGVSTAAHPPSQTSAAAHEAAPSRSPVDLHARSSTPPVYSAGAALQQTPPSAHSYVGSTTYGQASSAGQVAASQQPPWDDIISTASSHKGSQGWFGVFGGKRQQRSALV